MVLLGFAWFLFTLDAAERAGRLHVRARRRRPLGQRLPPPRLELPDRPAPEPSTARLAVAGYVIFPLAFVPALLFAGPHELRLRRLPRQPAGRRAATRRRPRARGRRRRCCTSPCSLSCSCRAVRRWRATERAGAPAAHAGLRLRAARPSCSSRSRAGAGDGRLVGGLRRHRRDAVRVPRRAAAQPRRPPRRRAAPAPRGAARVARAPRQAGDAERRRLERDLHDGAQARLVALALLLGTARRRADADPELPRLLESAAGELQTSLAELRELARGIHPAVLTERGPRARAARARGARARARRARGRGRAPAARPGRERRLLRRLRSARERREVRAGHVRERRGAARATAASPWRCADDGIGGADWSRGSGLRGLADRVAALDGTIAVDSPAGRGTRLRAELACAAA